MLESWLDDVQFHVRVRSFLAFKDGAAAILRKVEFFTQRQFIKVGTFLR